MTNSLLSGLTGETARILPEGSDIPMTSQTEKRLLTHSAMACARRCLRQYFYRYEIALRSRREATALRLGAAVHLGLELWSKGATPEAAMLAATDGYATCPPWAEPYEWQTERETVANLLAGYFWRYGNDTLEYVEIEKPWSMPLVNPATGRESRTYQLAGKRDGLVRVPDARLFVLERKTTGEEIGPDSEYWLRLRCDQQISLYTLSALHEGHDVSGVLYDVIRKPTIRPRQIPLLDEAGLKMVVDEATGERMFNKDGKPRQSAGPGMKLATRQETPEEFGARLLADIEERPDYYFQRREVPRLEDDLQAFRLECWQQAQLLSDCRRWGRWFRNVGRNTCSFCEYSRLCLQSITVVPEAPPDGFEIANNVHPELTEGEEG